MKPETLYKLTDHHNWTRDTTEWGENVTHEASRPYELAALCTSSVIHAYRDPLVALLLNPIHANIANPRLWEASGVVVIEAWDKVGCRSLTTIKQLPLPVISLTQKVAFAILCALEAYKGKNFVRWAKKWLSGTNRSYDANAAVHAAYAAYIDASAAASAAYIDASAAYTDANAVASATINAVYTARTVAYAAAAAARAAVTATKLLDIKAVAYKAMKIT